MSKPLRTLGSIVIFILSIAAAALLGKYRVLEVNATEYIIAALLGFVGIVKFLEWTEPPKTTLLEVIKDTTER